MKEVILLLNSLLKFGINMKYRAQLHEWAIVPVENWDKCEYVKIAYVPMEVDTREKNETGFTITPWNQDFESENTTD